MIDIEELIPLIEWGWVTMNSEQKWTWWPTLPKLDKEGHWSGAFNPKAKYYPYQLGAMFKIRPVADHTKALYKCGR